MKFKLVLVGLYVSMLLLTGGFRKISCQTLQYDYFKLTLRWPNSYCRDPTNTCRQTHIPPYFTIHGLWPEKNDGTELSNCPTTQTLTDAVLNLFKDDLLNYWPSLSTLDFQRSKSLWIHQWNKHGSCSSSKFNPQEWVERAILRTKAHDILCILKVAGIHPNGNSYASSAIIKAIQDFTLHKPDIVCNKDTNGNIYLYEVHLCFEYNGRVVQDCKGRARACEGKNPIFPATPRLTAASLLDEELNLKIGQGVEGNKTIDVVAANKK